MGAGAKALAAAIAILGSGVGTVRAQDAAQEARRRWTNVADLGLVTTGGNTRVTTLSLADKFSYRWSDSELALEGKALHSVSRTRALSNPDGSVRVAETTETTAEEYALSGRFRRQLATAVFAYTSGGWERNRLAGIRNRFRGAIGLGYAVLGGEREQLALELGSDLTREEQVAGADATFGGVQARLDYGRRVSETAQLDAQLEILESLGDPEDVRVNLVTGLTASVTRIFALKLGFTLNYDHRPPQVIVEGDAPGVPPSTFTFRTTDTKLSASLVINL